MNLSLSPANTPTFAVCVVGIILCIGSYFVLRTIDRSSPRIALAKWYFYALTTTALIILFGEILDLIGVIHG